MLSFASAAMTAALSQCSLMLPAVDSGVQVHSAIRTMYISLKLMWLALCSCGTVVLKSCADAHMLDDDTPGLRKYPPIPFCPDAVDNSHPICCGRCMIRIPFHCGRNACHQLRLLEITDEIRIWWCWGVVVRVS